MDLSRLMKKLLLLTFFLSGILLSPKVEARHIVGGEVLYECIGIDTIKNTVRFKITAFVYRDSRGGGAPFDAPANFGLYRSRGTVWIHQETFRVGLASDSAIEIDRSNPCLVVPDNVGVDEGRYEFEIELEISDTDSYQIVYQRCCRNNTIFNIRNPESTGAAYTATITPLAQRECDNSPTFNQFPPVVICADARLSFDHGATDVDGDQIVYSFCTPIAAGGVRGVNGSGGMACDGITPEPSNCPPPFESVTYKTNLGYRVDNPLGGDPQVVLDESTGLITGTPRTQGQFVVGICAASYRNGVLINEMKRDFQFNVTECEILVDAHIESTRVVDVANQEYEIISCGPQKIIFENESTDPNYITSYNWEFVVANGDTLKSTERNAEITFPGVGQYEGFMYLNREQEFEDCKDTATISVSIFPSNDADFTFAYDTCVAGPVSFTDKSVSGAGELVRWLWNFGDDNTSERENPNHKYALPGTKNVTMVSIDKNNCADTISKTFSWQPVPPLLIVKPDRFVGCEPATITFQNLSSPIDDTYDIVWDFGDGTTGTEISPSHVYEQAGVYKVTLDVTSPIGCTTSASFGEWIRIEQSPRAGFTFTPDEPSIFRNEIDFMDQSQDAISWLYIMDEYGALYEQNPSFTFPDTGVVDVSQIVTHETGCTDTFTTMIDIMPVSVLHMPNAFTPNADGLNDEFRGTGYFLGIQNYEMQIFNRWGELLYTTDDPLQGWDGRKSSDGVMAPPGVYIYKVYYEPARGKPKSQKGHVTLVR